FALAGILALGLRGREPGARAGRRLGAALGIPVLCLLASTIALRATNFARYGVFLDHDVFAPGFAAAYRALARIDPPAPRRYVTLPLSSREAAYAASPSFRTLQPLLEGPLRRSWIVDSCPWLQVCDDYANGWFLYALRDAVAMSGHYVSAPETDAFFARMGS